MIDSYITVAGSSCKEIVINRSRFIGYASPCSEEAEALDYLQKIRDEHKAANHHCYAYIIGENSGIMRYSDDGEPGGTAGLPMMDVLRMKGVVNCCVVSVRYFGGILLGTGELVRAYTQSAQTALEAAGIARMEMTVEEYCELPYAVWDKFRYAADRLFVRISEVEYGSAVCFRLSYRLREKDKILSCLMDASERKLDSILQSEDYSPWPIDD